MSLPYAYTPRPGEWLRVSRDETGRCMISVAAEERGYAQSVRILPEEVPGVARQIAEAMHELAGLPAPVILERPRPTFEGGINRAGRIEVGRLGGRVTVGLYGIQPEEIEPGVALRLAALIAIRAAEVQSDEPDAAQVEELTALFAAEAAACDRTGELDRTRARAALRWMAGKQQRGEQS